MSLDFTLDKYAELCNVMGKSVVLTFRDYLTADELPDRYIILRHDVDRSPSNALAMARIENDHGISASYYFRMKKCSFNTSIISKITEMGHEVGYHYEVMDKAKGNYQMALKIFEEELGRFRNVCDVRTICMHGNPLTKWNNCDLWEKYNFEDYGIWGEASLSVRDIIHYFTDTSRTWNWKFRQIDRIPKATTSDSGVHNTNNLIDFIKHDNNGKTYVNAHPERWSSNLFQWSKVLLLDKTMNVGKRMAFSMRKQAGG